MVVLTSFPPPTEGVIHRQEKTVANIQGKLIGCGVLYVAESHLSWMGENGQGFSLEYPAMTVHAVSRDLSTFPQECIYIMVDADLGHGEEQNGSTESSDEEESSSQISEIRFIPEDKSSLDLIYKALTKCQELHPDEDESFSDGNDEFGYHDNGSDDVPSLVQDPGSLQYMGTVYDTGDDVAVGSQPVIGLQANGDTTPAGDTEPMDTSQFEDAE